jgi:hypothetical protein
MKNMSRRQVVSCALALLASACAPRHVRLDPRFFRTSSRKIAVAFTEPPALAARRAGPQGLLDVAINSAADGNLESHLKTIDVSPITRIAEGYIERLQAHGFEVKRISSKKVHFHSTLSPSISELQGLARRENVDSAILLTATCGTIRPYYGFIPLSAPSGYCGVTGRLYDLKTGEVQWAGAFEGRPASVPVIGEWDRAPDFPNLTVAVHKAMSHAQQYMLADLFQSDYTPAMR